MLTALLIAFQFPYQLILVPAFIIVFAVGSALMLRFPSSRKPVGGTLIVIGLIEALASVFLHSNWGFVIGFGIFIVGIGLTHFLFLSAPQKKPRLLAKKVAYVVLAIVVLASAVLISLRATNVIREDYLENFNYASSPNLTIKATITLVELNYEVNTGYSYHVFPAYLTVNVTEVVWGGGTWQNTTTASEYLHGQGTLIVCYDKTDVPALAVGQQIEVSGYFSHWIEDSLYSGKFVVAPSISGSYLKVL